MCWLEKKATLFYDRNIWEKVQESDHNTKPEFKMHLDVAVRHMKWLSGMVLCKARSRTLVILVDPFKLRIFCDSMILKWKCKNVSAGFAHVPAHCNLWSKCNSLYSPCILMIAKYSFLFPSQDMKGFFMQPK